MTLTVKVMALSSLQLALILCPPVLCVFAVTPLAPCQFTPLLNLHPLILGLMLFGWLHTRRYKVFMKLMAQNKTGKLCSHCRLLAAAVSLHLLFSSNHVIYLSGFVLNGQFLFNPQMP